jgi:hypothetical protein
MSSVTSQIDILVQVRDQLEGLRRTQEGFQELQRSTNSWLSSFRNGAAFAVAQSALSRIGDAMREAAAVGIRFNAALEQARLGIAAVQRQANPQVFRNLDAAMGAATNAVELLQQKARQSPASFSQLVEGFQAITGAATAAGIPLSKQVDLTVLLSQAVAALGLRSEQFVQESRALLTGNITEDAALAKMLGIRKEDLDQAKQAGTLFEFLTQRLGAFREAGERSANTFTVLWSNLADSIEQASAAAMEPAFEAIKEGLRTVGEFDWQGAGQRAKEFVSTVIEAWKDGRLTELIALTLEVGFELGWKAIKEALFSEGANDLAGNFLRFIARLSVALTTSITQLGLEAASAVRLPFVAVIDFIAKNIVTMFENAFARVRQQAAQLYNSVASRFGSASRMDIPGGGDKPLPSFGDSWENAKAGSEAIMAATRDFFGQANAAAGFLWGGAPESGPSSAEQRLAAFAVSYGKAQDAAKATTKETDNQIRSTVVLVDWKKAELEANEELRDLGERRAIMEGDFTLTAAQKWQARLNFLNSEKQAVEDLIQVLEARAALEPDSKVAEQIRARADTARGKLSGIQGQISGLGPDPDNAMQQIQSKWTALVDRIGTDSQRLADLVIAPFEGLFTGLSSSIEGLINGTMRWGEALMNIGRSIVQSLVKAFADMVAQWIMSHIIMKGVSLAWHGFLTAIGAERVAVSNAQEAAKTPALAANATLASIGSWGTAVLVGVAAIAAILSAVGAFADGGLVTGPGGPRDDRVLARLSPGEYVVPADAVQAIGMDRMEQIRDGNLPMAAVGSPNVNVAPAPVQVMMVNSEAEMLRLLEEKGADVIIRRLDGRKMDLGMQA